MPPGRLTKSGCRQSNAMPAGSLLVQQPKLAGNIYHHRQRELRYANTYPHAYCHTNPNAYGDTYTYAYTNSHSYGDADPNRDTYFNACTDPNSDIDGDANGNSYADSDSYWYTNTWYSFCNDH